MIGQYIALWLVLFASMTVSLGIGIAIIYVACYAAGLRHEERTAPDREIWR